MTGKVTVIIATRDRRDELTHTLRQLHALAPPPPVIVVDNGSTDAMPPTSRRAATAPRPRILGAGTWA